MMNRKIWIPLLSGVLAVLAAVILPRYIADYRRNVAQEGILYVRPGWSYETLMDSLGLRMKKPAALERSAEAAALERNFHPGRYRLKASMRNKDIVRMLQHGWQQPFMLTLSGNIRSLEKLSAVLGKKLACDSAQFAAYFSREDVWKEYGFSGKSFQTMFLPNTYEVFWTVTPEQFTQRMKKEYDRFWNEKRRAKAAKLGLTPTEVAILASIVCEETNHVPEMPAIAGVYVNRLQRGMKLEADPTVKYAWNDPSIRRILYRHLEIDSPYNTYRYAGLPPGPITIPSIAGLDAVLDYKVHDYLYFCASPAMDGTHRFARTLSQHNRNAREYQAALNRMKIRK